MIPAVAKENLAEFIDVFCDEGFFTVEETERMMQGCGQIRHRSEDSRPTRWRFSGGVQVGVRNNALSVDHLERMGAEEIKVLAGSRTMPTMLPGAAFFLEMPFPPARQMIEAGLVVWRSPRISIRVRRLRAT